MEYLIITINREVKKRKQTNKTDAPVSTDRNGHFQWAYQFSWVQSLSPVWLFSTPWTAARQASPFITNSWSLLKLISIESVMPFNHLIHCHPLLLLPTIFLSIRVFSNESALLIRWPKDGSFSFSISPSNEYSGLISFKMDWFDLLAIQGTLKSLLQYHSSKALILQRSAFFMVQLSYPYMTTGKTIALTRQAFVGKVVSAFNMLSRLVIAFLPRSKRLHFMAAVTICSDFGARENKLFHNYGTDIVLITLHILQHILIQTIRWHRYSYSCFTNKNWSLRRIT